MGFNTHHHAVYRDDEHAVNCEVITRKNAYGEFLKGKMFFHIDDDPREFITEEDMVEAYNEKFKQYNDSPEIETIHIIIHRKRKNPSEIISTESNQSKTEQK